MTHVDAGAYYASYAGHQPQSLQAVLTRLATSNASMMIYLLGDSTLDNKVPDTKNLAGKIHISRTLREG